MYVCMCVCVCVCMYVCVCVYVCIYVCMHACNSEAMHPEGEVQMRGWLSSDNSESCHG